MASNASAKKRIRRTQRRTLINGARIGRIRTYLRKVEEAIAGGDREQAVAALRAAQPELMRGVNKGVINRNTMARKLSRLSARIKALAA